MKRALVVLALAFAVLHVAGKPVAWGADTYHATLVAGADAGVNALYVNDGLAGNQVMVTCPTYGGVTYRMCRAQDAGTCAATSSDAPIEAEKVIDLCEPGGWTAFSIYKQYDAGNPSCRLYVVKPRTVCQSQ